MQPPRADDVGSLWFVTVTLAGDAVAAGDIRAGLERLSHAHPFLLSGRYADDRAEIRYWEEAPDARCATDLALSLWADHLESAALPDWHVVGVEVIDRETFHRRGRVSGQGPGLVAAGGVSPL
ncbi:MAG: hypothetical protein ACR2KE_08615 [Candidatus Nanopelagicales bacterium]